MKLITCLSFLFCLISNSSPAQNTTVPGAPGISSEKRAIAIIDSLRITDVAKRASLQAILSPHFDSLYTIIEQRKAAMLIASRHPDKELANARSEVAWSAAGGRLNKLHAAFLGKLSVELTTAQAETVKDIMTESGRQKEYDQFLQLFPRLNDVQKAQLWFYLTEARENAMDAENADARRQWFIKYRGRANNFLSAAGYDLRKATKDLEARQDKNPKKTLPTPQ